jgi:hypothetical protein
MALVAIAMIAILAMAALSIDTVTLYLAREEAQRAADAAALAGARILSLSGMTGDPGNATNSWTPACNAATAVATAVVQQNLIAGLSLPVAQITVTFPNNPACGGNAVFGINPEIAVKVSRQNLPSFFARIWGTTSNTVVANATAEAFNPSNSGSVGSNGLVPVQPRCVKPWMVPNLDPDNAGKAFVDPATGSVITPGVQLLNGGVIGESFQLHSPCVNSKTDCDLPNDISYTTLQSSAGSLDYVPAQVVQSNSTAISTAHSPYCTNTDYYEMAIDGCDQQTHYNCGTANGANIDLDINPVHPTPFGGETSNAIQCMVGPNGGMDQLNPGTVTTPIYPFQIMAGLNNPLVSAGIVNNDDLITSSNSIVTLPIITNPPTITLNNQPVTVVGYLQAFIQNLNTGSPTVYVLNVSGCSGAATAQPVTGTSPVPIRLITPP